MRLHHIACTIGLLLLIAGCSQHKHIEGPATVGVWGGILRPVAMYDADKNQIMVAGLALDEGTLPANFASPEDPAPTDVPILMGEDGRAFSPKAFEANSHMRITGEMRRYNVRSPLGDRILGHGPVWAIRVDARPQ
jgi:hypothetical protein